MKALALFVLGIVCAIISEYSAINQFSFIAILFGLSAFAFICVSTIRICLEITEC